MIPRRRLLHAAAASGLLLVPLSACADEPGGGLAASEEVLERATTTEATTTTSPPTTEATTTTTTTEPPPTVEVGPLASGSHGPRTEALQANLARLGFDPGEPDGRFGAKTTMAVWAFQALNGLPKDGVVTEEVEARIAEAPAIAMLRPDLGPTHTEVDLDRQVLLVWGDGQLELVTHVSTGSGVAYCEDGHCGDAVTPVGDYRYQRRIVGERHAPLGVLYDPVYFVGGIAVHGAPSVPAHPASHGCVRIPMHVSAYFQDLVVDGEPIAVFRGGTGPAAPVTPPSGPAEEAPAGSENGG
ncbi:MAG: murein L,D-transpeptidase [Acidimicrobiales bacterium]|nr:murein L,D-transpeptidase [Acidimicrobiales bacterium]